jgi:hypothetical protein
MYLPLTGFRTRRNIREEDMSIDSISPNMNPSVVQSSPEATEANKEAHKVNHYTNQQEVDQNQDLTDERKQKVVDDFYSGAALSTQDFIALHNQSAEDPYSVLDEVISRMKENTEATGEMMEAIAELVKKTSKENMALQVLQKTLEGMDSSSGEER